MAELAHQPVSFSQRIGTTPALARAAFLVGARTVRLPTELPDTDLVILSDGKSRVQVNLTSVSDSLIMSDYHLFQDNSGIIVSCSIVQDTGKLRALNAGRGFPISGDEPKVTIESLKRFAIKGETFIHRLPDDAVFPNEMVGEFGASFLIASICLLAGAAVPAPSR